MHACSTRINELYVIWCFTDPFIKLGRQRKKTEKKWEFGLEWSDPTKQKSTMIRKVINDDCSDGMHETSFYSCFTITRVNIGKSEAKDALRFQKIVLLSVCHATWLSVSNESSPLRICDHF